jgi:hypothetical protein
VLIYGWQTCTLSRKTEVLLVASQRLGLEVSDEKARYMIMSRE